MSVFRRIWALFNRARLDREIEDELREHIQMRIDRNIANGMSAEQAAREARLRFGNPTVVKERVDAEDAALGLDNFFRDIRYAFRGFAKSPVFTAVAILTLALGIGANTAVFQLLDAVRLRSLPIQHPRELAELRIAGGNHGFGVSDNYYSDFTVPMWQEIRRHHDPFSGVFAWRTADMFLGKRSDARRVRGLEVSGEFFNVLGIAPWQGRLIEPQDEGTCEATKVVASYAFWKSQMAAQPITPNTTLVVEDRTVQVLGVTPPGFSGLAVGETFDLAYPSCIPPNPRRESFVLTVMGRLKPGWTLDRASAYLASISPGLFESTAPDGYSAQALKTYTSFRLAAYPAGSGVSTLRKEYDTSLQLLLAIILVAVGLYGVLSYFITRRRNEIGIRIALGARRWQVISLVLRDTAVMLLIGLFAGTALALFATRAAATMLFGLKPYDIATIILAIALLAVIAILASWLPARKASRVDPVVALRAE